VRINIANFVEKVEAAAGRQLQSIMTHGTKTWEEWLIKAESQTCTICKLTSITDCPLEALIAEHPIYREWEVCVKCGGRRVAQTSDKHSIYGDSSPVMIVGSKGWPVATKCDCVAADKTWSKTTPLAPEPFQSMCQLQRFLAYKAALGKAMATKRAAEEGS